MKTKAVTLIELLFVVIIVGILATLVFPGVEGFRLRAQLKEVPNTVEMIRAAERLFRFKDPGQSWYGWSFAQAWNDYIVVAGPPPVRVDDILHLTLPRPPQALCLYRVNAGNDRIVFSVDIDGLGTEQRQGYYDMGNDTYHIDPPPTVFGTYLMYLDSDGIPG